MHPPILRSEARGGAAPWSETVCIAIACLGAENHEAPLQCPVLTRRSPPVRFGALPLPTMGAVRRNLLRVARSHRLLIRNMNPMIKLAAPNKRITTPSTISVLATVSIRFHPEG